MKHFMREKNLYHEEKNTLKRLNPLSKVKHNAGEVKDNKETKLNEMQD